MLKQIIALFIFSLFISNTKAQKIMHSLGAGVNLDIQKITQTNPFSTPPNKTTTESFFHVSGDYMFRYNVTETENSSVSLGAPIAVGFGSVSDGLTDAAGLFFATDLSLAAFYNSGLKSTKENESNFGYFLGAGASYGHISIYYDKVTTNINTYGPIVYTGIRFPIKNQIASVGLFFRYGVDKTKIKTFGLKLMRDF
jgi:hypothetical protein